MDEEINGLFDAQLIIVLKLIRTNSTSDDVLKITQAADNLVRAKNSFNWANSQESNQKKNKGTGA